MMQSIRAIYNNGQLRLLDPIELSEGQEVEVLIVSSNEKLQSALSDLLVSIQQPGEDNLDELALLQEIESAFQGQAPLSQDIIDERNEGL